MDIDGANRVDIPCPGALQAIISPSGKYYAYPEDDGNTTYQLFVAPTDGGAAKSVTTKTGVIEWRWDNDRDVLIYTGPERIELLDVDANQTTKLDAVGSSMGLELSPDQTTLLYAVAAEDKTPGVYVWDLKTSKSELVYEKVLPDYSSWSSDSSAFMTATINVGESPKGVLAAEASGKNATFVPGGSPYGFTAPDTFLVKAATGSLEAWKLGATQGVELFSEATYVTTGDGFVVHCAHPDGTLTLINDDGSNRHVVDGSFECQAGFGRSGRYVAAVKKGFAGAIAFRDTTLAPEELPSPGATVGVRGSLRGGEGFTLDSPEGKSSWVYRPELEFILAKPSQPLFNIGGGVLIP